MEESALREMPDDEFDVVAEDTSDSSIALERLKHFSYYLVENVELNLNLCLNLLEERNTQSKPNSLHTTIISKLFLAIPKVGSAMSNAISKGEVIIFDKIDKNNSRTLADLVYYFSDHKEEFRGVLIQSAIDIFYSFERQFMKLTCKGGPKRAMQKLAKDASDRIFNYFLETKQNDNVTRVEVTKGVLYGDSKRNKAGIKEGKTVMEGDTVWKTCKLYKKTGIVIAEDEMFYKNENSHTEKYGHRRLLPWEDANEIKQSWQKEEGYEIQNYMLVSTEGYLKDIRDYIMTKNAYEAAKLERENYTKEGLIDRNKKHEEVLGKFEDQFKELLIELERQYRVTIENHRENSDLVKGISKNQEDEMIIQREITVKLDEIKKNIDDTKILLESSNKAIEEPSSSVSVVTIETVKSIVKEESNKNLESQIVNLVKEKLRKNDPGPKIQAEVNRTLKKLKLKKW